MIHSLSFSSESNIHYREDTYSYWLLLLGFTANFQITVIRLFFATGDILWQVLSGYHIFRAFYRMQIIVDY